MQGSNFNFSKKGHFSDPVNYKMVAIKQNLVMFSASPPPLKNKINGGIFHFSLCKVFSKPNDMITALSFANLNPLIFPIPLPIKMLQ